MGTRMPGRACLLCVLACWRVQSLGDSGGRAFDTRQ